MSALDDFLGARDFLLEHRDDYATAYAEFRWPQLDEFNWALDFFDHHALGNEAPALWLVDADGREEKFSFEQMRRRSNQVANYLRAQGLGRGDSLLLMLDNVAPLWDVMLAAIKLGAVIIPATTLLARKDLEDRLARGKARHVVAGAEHTDKFAGLETGTRITVGGRADGWQPIEDAYAEAPEFVPEGTTRATDPLLLYFTSGTTSKPKLVQHSHQSYPVGHLSTMYWIGLRPGDIHLNISSPGWAKHAWSSFFAPWNAGATIFVYRSGRFDAVNALDTICAKGVTSICAPPTVWRLFIQEDLERWQPALKSAVGAGEPLNPEIIARVQKAWGVTLRDGYGQTETTAQIANPPGETLRPGAMGRPLPGYRIALLDPDGKETNEGEIAIQGDPWPTGLMQGYRDDEARTEAAMHGGYYRTGDVASRDADGYLWYVGRADDVFKSSDYRISPFELESVLIEHDAVAEAAIVPSPDPIRLSVPKAYIVLRKDTPPTAETALEIFRFTRERLAPFQRIRIIEFAELPKTISGKIRRVELRKDAAEKVEVTSKAVFFESQFEELGKKG